MAAPHRLDELVRQACLQNTFRLLVLSAPQHRADNVLRVRVRPVEIKGAIVFQWAEQTQRQERHENLTATSFCDRIATDFPRAWGQAQLFTTDADFTCRTAGTQVKIKRSTPTRREAVLASHNRAKPYLIPEGTPCPFLAELGVMTPDGRVRAAAAHKFRQINRFLEFVEDIYPLLPATGVLSVADFGCGKSYLTFAVHHLLTVTHQREVDIVGFDRNESLLEKCSGLATRLGVRGLRFVAGELPTAATGTPVAPVPDLHSVPAGHNVETQPLHLALVLHACDTATDTALAMAVRGQALAILAAPCCQHEVSRLIHSNPLQQLLKHGILRERFSALATDALRALQLEAAGYDAQVMEFVDLEDSHKNLLIRGILRCAGTSEHQSAVKLAAYVALKQTLGLEGLAVDQIVPRSS